MGFFILLGLNIAHLLHLLPAGTKHNQVTVYSIAYYSEFVK
jgi:hypothetical protein